MLGRLAPVGLPLGSSDSGQGATKGKSSVEPARADRPRSSSSSDTPKAVTSICGPALMMPQDA